eukprot:9088523-Ditylum_brightwellii.AAC.1
MCAPRRSAALMQSGVHAGLQSTRQPNNKYCCSNPAAGMVFAALMACTAWVASSSSVSVHGSFPAACGAVLDFCSLHGAVASGYTCVGGHHSLLGTETWG